MEDYRYWINIREEVAAYVRFTAPNDEAAMAEAEGLWDEREIDFRQGVADVWKVRVEVTTENEDDSRLMEDDPFPVEVETEFDRFPDTEDMKTYFARYIANRSISSSLNVDAYDYDSPFVPDLDGAFKKVCEDYNRGFYYDPVEACICYLDPVVEVFRDSDLTADGFVGDQDLCDIC